MVVEISLLLIISRKLSQNLPLVVSNQRLPQLINFKRRFQLKYNQSLVKIQVSEHHLNGRLVQL